jgi:hypothetical protein
VTAREMAQDGPTFTNLETSRKYPQYTDNFVKLQGNAQFFI